MKPAPGDESVNHPYWYADQSLLLKAKPEAIWPWLAQMGNGRAGWYSYDWIDNFGKQSFLHIDTELQDLKQGQKISIFEVSDFKEPEYLTLSFSQKISMTYVLYPKESGTELFTRLRISGPKWLLALTMGPAHYIMQRKQLIEIKKRAEKIN